MIIESKKAVDRMAAEDKKVEKAECKNNGSNRNREGATRG